jgi:hypothetical protein
VFTAYRVSLSTPATGAVYLCPDGLRTLANLSECGAGGMSVSVRTTLDAYVRRSAEDKVAEASKTNDKRDKPQRGHIAAWEGNHISDQFILLDLYVAAELA